MRRSISRCVIAAFLAVICAGFCGTAYSEGGKVAYMDLSKTFDNYNKTKEFDKQLENKANSKESEREKQVSDIKKLKDEMSLMNDKAKEARQAVLDDKMGKLQDFDRDTKDALRKERDDIVRQILKEIKDVIEEVGKKEGYALILDSRAILYGTEGDDITEAILKTLNDRYGKAKR